MFTSLRIKGFKSWADTGKLRLAPVTGFFGANSAGKSGLLQAFILMKQTALSSEPAEALNLGRNQYLMDFGSLAQIRHHGILSQPAMSFEWVDTSAESALSFTRRNRWLSSIGAQQIDARIALQSDTQFGFTLSSFGNTVDMFSYRSGNTLLEYRLTNGTALPDSNSYQVSIATESSTPDVPAAEYSYAELPAPVKCYGFPSAARARADDPAAFRILEASFERSFHESLFYLGPLRRKGEHTYLWRQSVPSDVGIDGSSTIDALLAARDRGKINTRQAADGTKRLERISVEEHVAQWLRELRLADVFETRRLNDGDDRYEVLLRLTGDSRPTPLVDVGFGVSQVLPVLVLLAYVPEHSTVILEQPEVHLHPASQSGLADILLEAAKVRNLQILVESHSEHLLARLQRRIAEQQASVDDIALYFCEHNGQQSEASALAVNDLGEITNWPNAFFGDALGEAAAMVTARVGRLS